MRLFSVHVTNFIVECEGNVNRFLVKKQSKFWPVVVFRWSFSISNLVKIKSSEFAPYYKWHSPSPCFNHQPLLKFALKSSTANTTASLKLWILTCFVVGDDDSAAQSNSNGDRCDSYFYKFVTLCKTIHATSFWICFWKGFKDLSKFAASVAADRVI